MGIKAQPTQIQEKTLQILTTSGSTDIDHGKSTLSDRLLEITKTIPTPSAVSNDPGSSSGQEPIPKNRQVLDKLVVKRERGITVKAVSVRYLDPHHPLLCTVH